VADCVSEVVLVSRVLQESDHSGEFRFKRQGGRYKGGLASENSGVRKGPLFRPHLPGGCPVGVELSNNC